MWNKFYNVLVYVDNIIISGAFASFIQKLVLKLHSKFALKDLEALHYFLGLEVHHLANGSLLLSQQKYIHDLLLQSKMDKVKAISTLLLWSRDLNSPSMGVISLITPHSIGLW